MIGGTILENKRYQELISDNDGIDMVMARDNQKR